MVFVSFFFHLNHWLSVVFFSCSCALFFIYQVNTTKSLDKSL